MSPHPRPEWVEPTETDLKGRDGKTNKLYSVPPPGSGSVLGLILNVLDEYDLDESSLDPANEVVTYQRITESFKYAYAKRTFLGDAKFVDVSEVSRTYDKTAANLFYSCKITLITFSILL